MRDLQWSNKFVDPKNKEWVENMSEEDWEVIRTRAFTESLNALYNLENIARMDRMVYAKYNRFCNNLKNAKNSIVNWMVQEKEYE